MPDPKFIIEVVQLYIYMYSMILIITWVAVHGYNTCFKNNIILLKLSMKVKNIVFTQYISYMDILLYL